MDYTVFPFFVYFGFGFSSISPSVVQNREYHYVTLEKSWTDARRYCRENYTDLATFESVDDINKLDRSHLNDEPVWIGLHDDPKYWREEMSRERNSWRWSETGQPSTTGYQNWMEGEPNNNGLCMMILSNGSWVIRPCHFLRGFLCYDAATPPDQGRYIPKTTKVTWERAQEYCREHHTDLATIESDQQQSMVMAAKSGSDAAHWVGLYRAPWAWSDRSSSSFTNFRTSQPDNDNGNQYCVAEQRNHEWSDENCDSQFPFLCYKYLTPRVKSILKVRMKSDGNLTEPAISAQLVHQLGELLRIQNHTLRDLKWKVQPKKEVTTSLPTCVEFL